MSILRFAHTAVLIFSLFYSCKKEDLPRTTAGRLQRIIERAGDSALYTFFGYDAQNRLIAITDSNNNGHLWKTSIEYNALEKPVNFKVLYRNNPSGIFTGNSDSLIYSDNGRVIKKLSISYPYKAINTYGYDTRGRLTTDSGFSYWNNNEFAGYTSFTYDNSDNIVQWQTFYKSPAGDMNSGGIITASYNKENNYYKSLGLGIYFLRGDIFLLSKENTTQIQYYDGTTWKYQYEYFSNGLPEKAAITHYYVNGFFNNTSIEFFYD